MTSAKKEAVVNHHPMLNPTLLDKNTKQEISQAFKNETGFSGMWVLVHVFIWRFGIHAARRIPAIINFDYTIYRIPWNIAITFSDSTVTVASYPFTHCIVRDFIGDSAGETGIIFW